MASNDYSGVHKATEKVPYYFTYPSKEDCTLIASGEASAEFGCPRCAQNGLPYQSCSHGLDSFVCEYSAKK